MYTREKGIPSIERYTHTYTRTRTYTHVYMRARIPTEENNSCFAGTYNIAKKGYGEKRRETCEC